MLLPRAEVRSVQEILACLLPPAERKEFENWAQNVGKESFWRGLSGYFSDQQIKDAVAEYVIYQMQMIEHFLDIRIDALISVAGSRYVHGNFYEEVG